MKKFINNLLVLVGVIIMVSTVRAEHGNLGVGIVVGEPTGLSMKVWHSKKMAIDGAVAWSLGNNGDIQMHADYLWHNFNTFSNRNLPLYYGLGGSARLGDDTKIGGRAVMGVNYLFKSAPVDFFFELAPVFYVIPSSNFDITGGLGFRFYF